MNTTFDSKKVKVSWTKYYIVDVIDLVDSFEDFKKYYSLKGKIDVNILKSFACVKSLSDPIPSFWEKVFLLNITERKKFAGFWALFTSYEVASSFAEQFVKAPMRGVFHVNNGKKMATNLRSLLVESGLASALYRREKDVPFDGSTLLNSTQAGECFKLALDCYFRRNASNYDEKEFYTLCEINGFHKVFGLNFVDFKNWIDGIQKKGHAIKTLYFDKFLCYNSPCSLDFGSSKEIYIVGENGDGKTVLLMSLFMAFMGRATKMNTSNSTPMAVISELESKLENARVEGIDNYGRKYTLDSAPAFQNFFAYGTHRGRYSVETDKNTYEKYGFMTLFDNDMTLHDPSDWLLKNTLKPLGHKELSFENLQRVLTKLLDEKVEIVLEDARVYYIEKGYNLTMKELSEGYRSIIIFVCDLLTKLSDRCSEGENVFEQPGVVLIDEICLHLHPRWQKTIVRKLRKLFPNLQFIMTTHSPVIVLGASEDAIFYRVIRENGETSVSDPYFRSNMDQWMLNTLITSSLFGMESAAMDGAQDKEIDTNSTYLMSRIEKRVEAKLEGQKALGKKYFTDAELDLFIDEILNTPS